MRADLTDRVAIVTGASSGIGAATARTMGRAGAIVVLVGRHAERLAAVADDVRQAGGRATAIAADLEQGADAVRVVAETVAAHGHIDLIVHSAGAFEPGPLAETTVESLDRQWAVNVRSPFLLTQAAVPSMPDGGAIVFISSTVAETGFGGYAAYSASKGAVQGMARSLAAELAPRLRVNVVAPGFTRTPMVTDQFPAAPEMEGWLVEQTPVGFLGDPEDIAHSVVFVASDLGRYVHGATLVVDGGWTAHG